MGVLFRGYLSERGRLNEQWHRREVLKSQMDLFVRMQMTMTAGQQEDRQLEKPNFFLDPGPPL